ncbi:MAG: hypothetical protein HUK16_06285 [Bacteroidales bacterium]|nr:hypothetical protein [Bacteroidales bacterium]
MNWKCGKIGKFAFYAFLWLLGTIISTVINGMPLENSMKGSVNVVFLIACIPFVAWLVYDSPKRLLYFWLGLGISMIYNYYFQKTEILSDEVAAEVWGIYAYRYLFVAMACVAYYYDRKRLSYILLVGYGFFSLFYSSRNIFLTHSLAVTAIVFYDRMIDKGRSDVVYVKNNMWKLLLVLGLAFVVIVNVYENLAVKGVLGERAQEKYLVQSSASIGLASGRASVLETLYFCAKRPVWGYGSYALDKDNISAEYNQRYHTGQSGRGVASLVPGHSYLFGAWVYNGILGFFFFLWVTKCLFKGIVSTVLYDRRYVFLNVTFITILLWDVFFSPFQDRILVLMTILTLFYFEKYYMENREYC